MPNSLQSHGLYRLPGSSVHWISQARILERIAIPSSGDLPEQGIEPGSPVLQADSLPAEPPGKPVTEYILTLISNSINRSMHTSYGFDPWVRKIPWRSKWQLTSGFLPGKFHGQRSLEGYSLWGREESDMLRLHRYTSNNRSIY